MELPHELVSSILEYRCVSNIRQYLADRKCGFIVDELQKHDALIAGSLPLQCALEHDYKSDVDIYIPHTTDKRKAPNSKKAKRITEAVQAFPEVVANASATVWLTGIYVNDELIGFTSDLHAVTLKIAPLAKWGAGDHKRWFVDINSRVIRMWVGMISWAPVQPLENIIYETLRKDLVECTSNSAECEYGYLPISYTRIIRTDLITINIVVLREPVKTFVETTFDSDLCSIWYDGVSLSPNFHNIYHRIFHMQMTMRLLWKNANLSIKDRYNQVLPTAGYFTPDTRVDKFIKTCERTCKYIKRGFLVKQCLVVGDVGEPDKNRMKDLKQRYRCVIRHIPAEIQQMIFGYLHKYERATCLFVNKAWYNLLKGTVKAGIGYPQYLAGEGYLELLQWGYSKGSFERKNVEYISMCAARRGHVDVLEWLGGIKPLQYDQETIYAIKGDQTAVLDYFEKLGVYSLAKCARSLVWIGKKYDADTGVYRNASERIRAYYRMAVRTGRGESRDWLINHGYITKSEAITIERKIVERCLAENH